MSRIVTKQTNDVAYESGGTSSSTASLVDDSVQVRSVPQQTKKTLIEPVFVILLIAVNLSETAIPNVIELHFCRAVLGISDNECFNNTSKYKTEVQTFTSTYGMIKTFTEVLLPCFASFCVGSWSDVFGRKPIILFASLGYFMSYCLWTWLTTLAHLHPLGFIIASIPIGFTGSTPIFMMASFCYMCDITTIEKRAVRLGVLQCLIPLASLIGTLLCPYVAAYNYTAVFGVSATLCYLCMIYIYFLLDESVECSQEIKDRHSKNPLSLTYAYDLFDTCFTKLDHTCRLTVLFLTISLTFTLTVIIGEMSLLYLFMQDVLGWNLQQYSTLNAFQVITSVLGTTGVLVYFSRRLKVNDLYLLCCGIFLRILGSLTIVFGFKIWHIYLSRFLCSFSSLIDPLIRSFLSKMVPHEELGKIFSILAAGGNLTPLLASGFYSMVYNVTVDDFPSGIFLMSGALLLITLYFLILTYILNEPGERKITTPLPINVG